MDALQGDMNSFNKRLTKTEVKVGENFKQHTVAEETIFVIMRYSVYWAQKGVYGEKTFHCFHPHICNDNMV